MDVDLSAADETQTPKKAGPGLQVFTVAQLLQQAAAMPDRWVVDGRLPVGGTSILGGRPKVGKTTLARSLALAVVRGEPWLGFDPGSASTPSRARCSTWHWKGIRLARRRRLRSWGTRKIPTRS